MDDLNSCEETKDEVGGHENVNDEVVEEDNIKNEQKQQEAEKDWNDKQGSSNRGRFEDSESDCSQRRSRSSTDYPRCYYAIKDRMVGRLFMGEYLERRRVKQINKYRDVVAVNPSEMQFLEDLKYVLRCAKKENASEWLPITAPSSNLKTYRLWVSLPGVPFDKYWFYVRSVKYVGNELSLRLKVVRNVVTKDLDEPTKANSGSEFTLPKINFKANMVYLVTHVLTMSNLLNACRLLVLALTGLLAGLVEFMKHVGMWSIAFTREAGIVIERCTPLGLGILNFVSKIFGGLFLLLTMLWRDLRYGRTPAPPPPRVSYRAIGSSEAYYENRRRW